MNKTVRKLVLSLSSPVLKKKSQHKIMLLPSFNRIMFLIVFTLNVQFNYQFKFSVETDQTSFDLGLCYLQFNYCIDGFNFSK